MKKWIDACGVVHDIPEGSCVICKNCTDIFLDSFENNKIYLCLCSIHSDTTKLCRHCKDFVEDENTGVRYEN